MGRCMIQIYIYRIKRLGPHIFPTITSQCVMFPSETVENQFARKSSTMSLGWWKWNRPHYEIQTPGERFAGIKYAWNIYIYVLSYLFIYLFIFT